eukprot:TRINITY_DN3141_c0_g1_i1.p1 TRINITY_DN3141_c0_g1~~TRINITY_DN3141_c0_g1_i1.p1  ORF type:complete len:907 (+),score=155.08 TRINITY_DN3141_c0_g1_i1:2429-5149(+)
MNASYCFNGVAPISGNATNRFQMRAIDSRGAVLRTDLLIGHNNQPVANRTLPNLVIAINEQFEYLVPPDAFADVDYGDIMVWTAQQATLDPLPVWMTFDAFELRFDALVNSTWPPFQINITVTDIWQTKASQVFNVTVAHRPTTIGYTIANATTTRVFSYTIPASLFNSADGSAMVFEVTGYPGWVTYNTTTQHFNGTTPAGLLGSVSTRVTATDIYGLSNNATLEFFFNTAPVANVIALPSQVAVAGDPFWSYQIPLGTFSDADGDNVTFRFTMMDDSPAPSFVGVDDSTWIAQGSIPGATSVTYVMKLWVYDPHGLSAWCNFTLVVSPVCRAYTFMNQPFEFANDGSEPFQYVFGQNCTWHVQPSAPVSFFTITFLRWDVGPTDRLIFTEGSTNRALGTYSGQTSPNIIISFAPWVEFNWITLSSNLYNGWMLTYQTANTTFDSNCVLSGATNTTGRTDGRGTKYHAIYPGSNIRDLYIKVVPTDRVVGTFAIYVTNRGFPTETLYDYRVLSAWKGEYWLLVPNCRQEGYYVVGIFGSLAYSNYTIFVDPPLPLPWDAIIGTLSAIFGSAVLALIAVLIYRRYRRYRWEEFKLSPLIANMLFEPDKAQQLVDDEDGDNVAAVAIAARVGRRKQVIESDIVEHKVFLPTLPKWEPPEQRKETWWADHCKLPGCSLPRFRDPQTNILSDFCGLQHEEFFQLQSNIHQKRFESIDSSVSDHSAMSGILPSAGTAPGQWQRRGYVPSKPPILPRIGGHNRVGPAPASPSQVAGRSHRSESDVSNKSAMSANSDEYESDGGMKPLMNARRTPSPTLFPQALSRTASPSRISLQSDDEQHASPTNAHEIMKHGWGRRQTVSTLAFGGSGAPSANPAIPPVIPLRPGPSLQIVVTPEIAVPPSTPSMPSSQ